MSYLPKANISTKFHENYKSVNLLYSREADYLCSYVIGKWFDSLQNDWGFLFCLHNNILTWTLKCTQSDFIIESQEMQIQSH